MNSQLSIKTALALTLGISAIAATSALARPNLEPSQPSQSQAANARPEVHPNADLQARRTGNAGIPPILRRATPPERARIRQAEQNAGQAQKENKQLLSYTKFSTAETNAYAHVPGSNIRPETAPDISHNGRFDWGDAGIGGAGGFALALLGLGGVLMVSRRHAHRSRGSATATS
jgi:hypothetical protein